MAQSPKEARPLRPDSKGRISLPKKLYAGISGFTLTVEPNGRIILDPLAEIPARELWLHQNPTAKEQVQRGLAQSAAAQTVDRGSFAHYADDADDDSA